VRKVQSTDRSLIVGASREDDLVFRGCVVETFQLEEDLAQH
jgi:hypothetical protein